MLPTQTIEVADSKQSGASERVLGESMSEATILRDGTVVVTLRRELVCEAEQTARLARRLGRQRRGCVEDGPHQ